MTLFLATLAIISIAFVGMAIGVILSNRCLKGTCGGLSSMSDGQGGTLCDVCDSPPPECTELIKKREQKESNHSSITTTESSNSL